jgi:hypothetical protein
MNQVAQTIETKKASEIYDFSLVPSDQFSLVWDQIEKFLEKSARSIRWQRTELKIFIIEY